MKKLLVALGGLLALLILAVLIGPMLVPTDAVRAGITETVRAATGRDLRISGPVRLRLLPSPGLTAETITFANPAWASTPEMVKVKSFTLDLGLLPLLSGRIDVTRLVLSEPEIDLEIARDRRANWQFDRPKPPAPSPDAAGQKPASPRTPVSLNDVRIEAGRITYRDAGAGTSETVDHIALTLVFPGLDHPIALNGSLVWNGEPVTIALAAAKPGALLAGENSAMDLTLAAAPLKLAFAGDVLGLPPRLTTGTIDIAAPSLRRLVAWLGRPLAIPGDGLGPLAIKGKLAAKMGQISFEEATIALDAIRAEGNLALTTDGPRPILGGMLKVGVIDLNPYLPEAPPKAATPKSATPKPAPAFPAADEGWSDTPLDFAVLHAFDATLGIVSEQIVWRKLRFDKTGVLVQLKAGKLDANLQKLTLYGGTGKARLVLDAAGPTPSLAVSLNLLGTQIDPLLDAAIGMDRLAGIGSLDLSVITHGTSQRALVSNLDGQGDIRLADGQIKGVNLLDIARAAIPGGGGAKSGGGTNFGSLSGTFRIEAGILRNDDLQLKSGLIPTTGAGTIDLPARTIDYRAVPQLAGAIKIPVRITGPWNRISYLPDGTENVRGLIQQPGNLLRGLLPKP
jgi:AsmA protein